MILKCGFFHSFNDLLIKAAVNIVWEGEMSFRVSVDFEGIQYDRRFEKGRGNGFDERANFMIDIFHTRIILFVYRERVFGLFKN